MLAPDGSGYINSFRARLTAGGRPLAGQEVEFRFNTYWNEDGSVNTTAQEDAPDKEQVCTDAEGWAVASAVRYNGIGDIHLAYNVDVVCHGSQDVRACTGPMMTILALTPRREAGYPYDAYFAGGTLYLAPQFLRDFPQAEEEALRGAAGGSGVLPQGALCEEAVERLLGCGVLRRGQDGALRWIHSVMRRARWTTCGPWRARTGMSDGRAGDLDKKKKEGIQDGLWRGDHYAGRGPVADLSAGAGRYGVHSAGGKISSGASVAGAAAAIFGRAACENDREGPCSAGEHRGIRRSVDGMYGAGQRKLDDNLSAGTGGRAVPH